jgi:RNA polymerase sigma-70 factor (ECF subfamily)
MGVAPQVRISGPRAAAAAWAAPYSFMNESPAHLHLREQGGIRFDKGTRSHAGVPLMKFHAASLTSETLLGRLRHSPDDQAAWNRFVERYGPKIYGWCCQWRLQEADAEDVTQNVLLRLVGKLRNFTYDPSRSFRSWLRTLTAHACSDFFSDRERPDRASGDTGVLEILKSAPARADLLARREEEFDQEVMAEAQARVRLRVEPQTWEAFQLASAEGISGADTAARLGMPLTAVFKARSRVLKLLRDEVARLEQGSDSTESPAESGHRTLDASDGNSRETL